ncbi:MAG: HK97 gp10 family phage protein [Dorea sp.]|nr:HK97 gp10 family phage protein [Dorea sp.]
MAGISIEDHIPETLKEMESAVQRALERIGMQAEGYAKAKCPVDTGALRNSITHQIQGHDVYIGTNMEYAPYIEFGTGIHAETGGRQTPWTYQDGKGNWHKTSGAKAKPFLRPAASKHNNEYAAIIADEFHK